MSTFVNLPDSLPDCPKCGAALVAARLYDPPDDIAVAHADELPLLVWHCAICRYVQRRRSVGTLPGEPALLKSSSYTRPH